jgi:hypothetical protein
MTFFNCLHIDSTRMCSPLRLVFAMAALAGLLNQEPSQASGAGAKRNAVGRPQTMRAEPKSVDIEARTPAHRPEFTHTRVADPGRTVTSAITDLTIPEKSGVTLYQINGFHGRVPMKAVTGVGPHGAEGLRLEFASSNMNQTTQWMAKAVAPSGTVLKSFQVASGNGIVSITPNSADSYDGRTIVDKVAIKPWNLISLLRQCREQMTNSDGSFKNSVTFDLQGTENQVRGNAVFAYEANPNDPTKWVTRSAKVNAKTRVTAYLVDSAKLSKPARPSRLSVNPSATPAPNGINQLQTTMRRPFVQKPSTNRPEAMPRRPSISGFPTKAVPPRGRTLPKRLLILDEPSSKQSATRRHSHRRGHRRFYEQQLKNSYRYPDRNRRSR